MRVPLTIHWKFAVYVLLVIAWSLVQLLTDGVYFRLLTLAGPIVGYGAGLGIESARYGLESIRSASRAISRASLYAVPLAFSGSLLALTRFATSAGGLFGAALVITAQVAIIVYLSRVTTQRF